MESPSSTVLFLLLLLFTIPLTLSEATTFDILNSCPYTVWAAAVPGGGCQLEQGQSWTVDYVDGRFNRIWARTGCSFDENGSGRCQTGDCDGLLKCKNSGTPPCTLAEFDFRGQIQNLDFYDISLVDGFNVPLEISPSAPSGSCRGIRCAADITARCPEELRAPGGCNAPCRVFKTNEYCCNSSTSGTCQPTNYSRFFKNSCPDAYSYPMNDATSTFTCPSDGDYRIVFCPSDSAGSPSGSALPDELTTGFGQVAVRLVIPEI